MCISSRKFSAKTFFRLLISNQSVGVHDKLAPEEDTLEKKFKKLEIN